MSFPLVGLVFTLEIFLTGTVGAAGHLVLESGGPVFFLPVRNPTLDDPLLESGMSVILTPLWHFLYIRETQGKLKPLLLSPHIIFCNQEKHRTSLERPVKILRGLCENYG